MSSHWRFRTIRHEDEDGVEYFGVHETFYNDDSYIEGYAETAAIMSDTKEGLNDQIKMLLDALAEPVLDEDDIDDEIMDGLDIE